VTRRLLAFATVGLAGFAVDAAILVALLSAFALDPLVARLGSIVGALSCTWLLNRTFTFGASDRHPAAEGLRYGGVEGLSYWFWVKMALIVVMIGAMIVGGRLRAAGNVGAAAGVAWVSRAALVGVIIAAVLTFE